MLVSMTSHCNSLFGLPGLPGYQHFFPSMMRQLQ
jgi:hypothetical protein